MGTVEMGSYVGKRGVGGSRKIGGRVRKIRSYAFTSL